MTIRLVNEGPKPFCVSVYGQAVIIPSAGGGYYVSDVEPVMKRNKQTGEEEEVARKAVLKLHHEDPTIPNFADFDDMAMPVLMRGDIQKSMTLGNVRMVRDIVASVEDQTRQTRDQLRVLMEQKNAIIAENERLKRENEALGTTALIDQLKTETNNRKDKR